MSETTMTNALRSIEQMVLTGTRDRRVIGITSPHSGTGVSTISSFFAEIAARWGTKTLLVDMTEAALDASNGRRWAPGLGDPRQFLEPNDLSYDVLYAVPTPSTLGAFNSARYLRERLEADLEEYGTIILDLPAILDYSVDTVNPLIASVACDAVIVVCAKGRTTSDHLKQTVETLRVAGGPVVGTVLNDLGAAAKRRARKS